MPAGRLYARSVLLQAAASLRHGVTQQDLARLGLELAALQAPDLMVGADAIHAHLTLVAERAPYEPFVVEVARAHTMATMGPVGFHAQSAGTVRACLEAALRYWHLSNTLARFELQEVEGVARWVEHRAGPDSPGRALASELAIMTSLNVARALLRREFVPLGLSLLRSSADTAAYSEFVGRPVQVGATRAEMLFPAHLLEERLATADPELGAYFRSVLDARDATEVGPSIVAELRRVLPGRFGDGEPDLESVARALGISTRSLQRRLEAERLTFSGVVEQVRAELAEVYLSHPQLTAAEVAYLLGYSEASSFHRAFRRWKGTTPQRFRAELTARTGGSVAEN